MKNSVKRIFISIFFIMILSINVNASVTKYFYEITKPEEHARNILNNIEDRIVTRADAVMYIMSIINEHTDRNMNIITTRSEPDFSDVNSNIEGHRDIIAAKEIGLIEGNGLNEFYPDESITRQDYSKMAGKMFEILKSHGIEYKLPKPSAEELADYKDYHLLRGKDEEYFSIMLKTGILEPKVTVTRKSPNLTVETQKLKPYGKVTEDDLSRTRRILNDMEYTNFTNIY